MEDGAALAHLVEFIFKCCRLAKERFSHLRRADRPNYGAHGAA
jgi:hypothetical protein